MRQNAPVTPDADEADPLRDLTATLLDGWSAGTPDEADAAELTELLRRHEDAGRGWATASEEDLLVDISPRDGDTRENVVLRDPDGVLPGWASAHDRAAGRMLLVLVVDRQLDDATADRVAEQLFGWADGTAVVVGGRRGLDVQQIDSGAFADDDRQHRWLEGAGFEQVRTWWQMSRPVDPGEADLDADVKEGVRIRPVERQGTGMPAEDDLRTVHDILESAFADHFNSHEETFDEFLSRLREDPGHRWDHWWIAELVDGDETEPAGALAARVPGIAGCSRRQLRRVHRCAPECPRPRRREVAADDRDRRRGVPLPRPGRTRGGCRLADRRRRALVSMGWKTRYVTESWHRNVPVPGQ